jgi:ubiquinone/menaquinone biosynthesis C-methylase UbiE
MDFAEQLGFGPGTTLLDIDCGLGGASRYFAHERGCRVTGLDLTAEYIQAAKALAKQVGLAAAIEYRQGSALALPFAPATFDGAYMLHVGMNIENKASLFAQVWRVLKPGGVFGIYDVMQASEGDLDFPVPWAETRDTSFVASATTYRQLLEGAGFEILKERSRRDFSIEFFNHLRSRTAQAGGLPPLGLHLLMGPTAPQKVANMIDNLERGLIAPTEIVCRASSRQ